MDILTYPIVDSDFVALRFFVLQLVLVREWVIT